MSLRWPPASLWRPRFTALLTLVLIVSLLSGHRLWSVARAAGAPQSLPFSQAWSDVGLITANDNWSGVPGVIGYRGDDLTTATGTNPQTILADGTTTPVDVNANQSNPSGFTTGGVAEFELDNPTIALNGSGTADAPFILISLNTTGSPNVTVSYSLRDLDGSGDNAVQPVAVQFRVGNAGNFTDLPSGFVPDATDGPNLSGRVTPVSVALPPAAGNQPLVQVRVITADAVGSDEWVGIDDIQITGTSGPTPPTGLGSASPAAVAPGAATLLTVTVTPGANPTSTGITVTGDLGAIGGSAAQPFFDDATNGDVTANDNIFSFLATVPAATPPGPKTLPLAIADGQGRSGTASIALGVQGPQTPQTVIISQVYGGGGNSGASFQNDFVELFNRGGAPVSLADWSVQYSSAAGTSWQKAGPLSGTLAPGQYYLVQLSGGTSMPPIGSPLPAPDATGTINLSSTSGKVALVNNNVTTASGTSCPTGANIVDLVGYGAANCFEGSGPAPELSNTTAALRARRGCRDTNSNVADFSAAGPVPRNTSTLLNDCAVPPPSFAINAIQGSGADSPLAGREVSATGVVTARKRNGFFLQTPDVSVDADPNTSEGLFVFTGGVPAVSPGDAVTAIGTVTEFFGLTQLSSSNLDVTVTSGGNTLPAAITLTPIILNPAGPRDQLERFEGMRLAASSLMTVAPSDEFGEIFAVLSGVPRPFREPGIEISRALPPGSPANVPRFDQNPERIAVDTDGLIGSTRLTLTSLVTLSNVVGPLEFSFGNYKILPETTPAATANLTATPVPAAAANEFTVASFNLENFYNTDSNFAERLTKASLVIRNVLRSPDILGVEEVGDLATLTDLANRLNSDSGTPGPAYQPFLFESDDDTERDIDVGVLVKTSRVNVVSVTQEGKNATYLNPDTGQPEPLNDRTPLILRARVQSPTGSSFPVTVIVNHLRSLIDIDQDPGDGPRVREKRRKQAEFLATLTQSLQSENLVLVGDFNAFQFNDGYVDVLGTVKGQPTPPDQVVLASEDLVNPNLTALVDTLPAVQRYSFTFEGNPQTLDHVLVDDQMLARLSRFVYARNNADFPDDFQGDATRPERFSDHDMPVAYFSFPPPAADLSIAKADSPDPALTGATLTYTITVTNAGPDIATDVVVTDRLPARTTFASCVATGGVCSGSGNNRTVNLPSLAAGATETITLTATVDNLVFGGTTLSNTASVTSVTTDPGLGNNSATTTTTVNRALRITPVVECVTRSGGGDFTVRFGYENPNPVAITIPVGLGNFFAPLPIDRGQPTTFLPGRQQNVVTATGRYGILVWTLDGRAAVGLINSPNQCPQ